MLDEYCATSGYSRKHAIKVINGYRKRPKVKTKNKKDNRGRQPIYDSQELLTAFKNIWLASDQMCGKRLAPVLDQWLVHYDKHYSPLTNDIKHKLVAMSSAAVDRLLQPHKVQYPKGRTGTKPGSILKTKIPILTYQWDNTIPGFVEADTVAHCGDSLADDFIWSLDLTDIASGWTELRACWGKGGQGIVSAINDIEDMLPFKLKGFDCDNGSEFLNHHLLRYFAHPNDENKIRLQFTR